METRHTSGQWQFSKTLKNEVHVFYTEHDKEAIFSVTHNEVNHSEALANAKLIATSPEMLWLLGWIVNEIETTPDELSDALLGLIKIRCNETIKKATV